MESLVVEIVCLKIQLVSLKHSPNIVDIVNAVDAVRTVELDYTDLCGMDTLIIIDDDVICPLKIIGELLLLK